MVLLNMQWLANFRTLKHCAMVISTAYYGWGAKDTVSQVTSFLRIKGTRMTRDSFFKRLTSNCVESFCSLLASRHSGLIVWDDYQRGQELHEQRGGRSSKFLIGMVEAAHRVLPFVQIWISQSEMGQSQYDDDVRYGAIASFTSRHVIV